MRRFVATPLRHHLAAFVVAPASSQCDATDSLPLAFGRGLPLETATTLKDANRLIERGAFTSDFVVEALRVLQAVAGEFAAPVSGAFQPDDALLVRHFGVSLCDEAELLLADDPRRGDNRVGVAAAELWATGRSLLEISVILSLGDNA